MFSQLRIRTEHSYRKAYGPIDRIADYLNAIDTPLAGIVDTSGTWGHVPWQTALLDRGIEPAFGAEIKIPKESEDGPAKKPVCWVLADDISSFYRFMSSGPETAEDLANAQGIVRFAGAALTDPDTFDYIDVNPRSLHQTRASLAMAKRTGKPVVLTSDADFPSPMDRDRFLAWEDGKKATPQHILSQDELRAAFWNLTDDEFEAAWKNTYDLGERLRGRRLRVAPMIEVDGDLDSLIEEGKRYRIESGHIDRWTKDHDERLKKELGLIREKRYESYFLVVSDMVKWAKERMLVGPARGSSAGSLVCFLLGITEVDPLKYNLIFERFIDVNRADLPDIDIDFNDEKRHLVFDYLAKKYGSENVARIGSINRLKSRSAMAHVSKKLGIPRGATFPVLNVLIEHSSGDSRFGKELEDTMTLTEPGKKFVQQYPEGKLIGEIENHASHTGVHAAGFIVANVPVIEYCTVRDGIAQIDKKDAEKLNLLKIDVLGLRTLGVIEDAGCVDRKTLYDLTLDDPEVLSIFNEQKYSGIFQFEGAAQRRVASEIDIDSFQKVDHVTALARPGPLGGGAAQAYVDRSKGADVEYKHPSMEDYLGDTFGVVLYQEQVMRIVREIGDFSWEETSTIRKAMSGRKGQEFFNRSGEMFIEGAAKRGIDAETANQIWNEICAFGAWGMNRSHTVSYAIISYWCAYMKRYHPLEFAAACLRRAKDDEQTIEILRELNAEGTGYIPFDVDRSGIDWEVRDGRLIGGFKNLVGIGPVKAAKYVAMRDAGELKDSDREAIAKLHTKHEDLTPGYTRWKDIYDNPDNYNIHGRVSRFDDLEDGEVGVVIAKLIRQDRRDYNEAVLIAKRGGKRYKGQTLFLDSFMVDDSVSKPIRVRIQSRDWHSIGKKLADRAVAGEDWFLVRGKWLGKFSMMSAIKIKCLTNPEIFA